MTWEPAPTPLNVLVVDDEPNIRKMLALSLQTDGHQVVAVANAREALDEAGRRTIDVAFVDLRLGTDTGMDLIPKLLAASPWMKIVVITAFGSIQSAVEAMKRGASDYLTKPFTPQQVGMVAEKAARLRALEQQVASLQNSAAPADAEANLASSSHAMQQAISLARQVASSDATVLLRGESGTGKGVLARAIHAWSKRADKPFATVSCPALPAQLLESELFGHVKGAFTGAVRDNPGRIAASAGGTLMLDEIGDLPLELQPKLLRFLQDHEYEPVGGTTTRRSDVRLISATNVDLVAAAQAGRFREDLLYRINVIQIDLPPLRQRVEDLPGLAERLLAHFDERRRIAGYSDEAMAILLAYPWPGNVRELRNVVERAAILCQGEQILPEHLPPNLSPRPASAEPGQSISLEKLEELHIRRVLAQTPSLDEAAKILGIDLATLYRRRKKYGM